MAFIDGQTVLTDPGLEEPPNDQDAEGNWRFISNAEGHWYNNPDFIEEPLKVTRTGATPGATDEQNAAFDQLRSDYEGLSTQLQNLIADAKEKATATRESSYDTL